MKTHISVSALVLVAILLLVMAVSTVTPALAWSAERATVIYTGSVYAYNCYQAFGPVCSYGQYVMVRTYSGGKVGSGYVWISGYGNPYHYNQAVWVRLSGSQIVFIF